MDTRPAERVVRVDAEGPDGLIDRKAPGKTPLPTPARRAAPARAVEAGPKPYPDGVVRWRLVDPVQGVREEFGVSVSRRTLGREPRAMSLRKLSARPRHHGRDPKALAAFEKGARPAGGDPRRAPGRDRARTLVAGVSATVAPMGPRKRATARLGQKTPITRRRARRGDPAAGGEGPAHDVGARPLSRTGGVRGRALRRDPSSERQGGGRVVPFADTEAMQAHLAGISRAAAPPRPAHMRC